MSQISDARESAIVKGDALAIATNTGTALMELKWIGSGVAATVAVAAGGDISVTTDGSTADTTIVLPSGGTDGTIDVSDASVDTLGEVVDHFNASANWQARLTGGLRTWDSDNTFFTLVATANCCNDGGVKLYADPAVEYDGTNFCGCSLAITAGKFRKKNIIRKDDDDGGWINELWYIENNLTYASGTAYIDIYDVDDVAQTATLVERLAASATTVKYSFGNHLAMLEAVSKGNRLVVIPTNTAAFTAGYVTIAGKSWNPDYVEYD